MKKVSLASLILASGLIVAGCGQGKEAENTEAADQQETAVAQQEDAVQKQEEENGEDVEKEEVAVENTQSEAEEQEAGRGQQEPESQMKEPAVEQKPSETVVQNKPAEKPAAATQAPAVSKPVQKPAEKPATSGNSGAAQSNNNAAAGGTASGSIGAGNSTDSGASNDTNTNANNDTNSDEPSATEDHSDANSGAAEETNNEQQPAPQQAATVLAAVKAAYGADYLPNMSLDAAMVAETFQLDMLLVEDFVSEVPMIGFHPDKVLIVKAKAGKVKDVVAQLQAARQYIIENGFTYPANLEKVQSTKVVSKGDYAAFFMVGSASNMSEVPEERIQFAENEVQKAVAAFYAAIQ